MRLPKALVARAPQPVGVLVPDDYESLPWWARLAVTVMTLGVTMFLVVSGESLVPFALVLAALALLLGVLDGRFRR
jgi:hypothetical protein